MQSAQPNWNISKLGNNADQWAIYDDNDNGRHVATVIGAYNARIISVAPKMLELLKDSKYDNTHHSREIQTILYDIRGNDSNVQFE